VGTIHINCNRGNVVRTEGMFAGATMRDVETEHDVDQEGEDDEKGIFSGPKARIHEAFRHARDDATDMFERVRQSFVDFINRH
jgi:hypothetical protein